MSLPVSVAICTTGPNFGHAFSQACFLSTSPPRMIANRRELESTEGDAFLIQEEPKR
jgi:hypothetical protein